MFLALLTSQPLYTLLPGNHDDGQHPDDLDGTGTASPASGSSHDADGAANLPGSYGDDGCGDDTGRGTAGLARPGQAQGLGHPVGRAPAGRDYFPLRPDQSPVHCRKSYNSLARRSEHLFWLVRAPEGRRRSWQARGQLARLVSYERPPAWERLYQSLVSQDVQSMADGISAESLLLHEVRL